MKAGVLFSSLKNNFRKRIQNPVKHLRTSVLQKQLPAEGEFKEIFQIAFFLWSTPSVLNTQFAWQYPTVKNYFYCILIIFVSFEKKRYLMFLLWHIFLSFILQKFISKEILLFSTIYWFFNEHVDGQDVELFG